MVEEASLDATVDELAASIAAKARIPAMATKRHTNAVTAQLVGTDHALPDADSLISALLDEECGAARNADIKARLGRQGNKQK